MSALTYDKDWTKRLFFSHNLISDESAQAVQSLLQTSASLREIRLNDNTQIGDDAGFAIA